MTISQAFGHLIQTDAFISKCKEKVTGAKHRVYKGRYNKGTLHELAMVSFLLDYGYSITVGLPKKKK